jgi:Zn-dependent protease
VFGSFDDLLAAFILIAIFLLVAFPIHEFSHALAAYRLGDSTARLFGRLTLNPLAHFDPVGGTLLALTILLSGGGFGWAKPTPVNPRNLEGGRWGEAIVAAAGPLSNLVLAVAGALPLRYITATGMSVPQVLYVVLFYFVLINLLLMIFNFIPIPPLDGGAVLFAFLPPELAWRLRPMLAQYGLLILILLIFPVFGGSSVIGQLFNLLLDPLFELLTGIPLR